MQHLCALILGLLTPVAALGAAIRSYAPGRSSYKSATPVYQTAVFSSSYSWQNVKEQAKAEGKYMDEEAIKENLRDAFSEQDIMDKDLDQMTREELLPKSRTCGKASVSIATVTDTNFVGTTLHFGVYCQKRQIRFRWYRTGRSSLRAV